MRKNKKWEKRRKIKRKNNADKSEKSIGLIQKHPIAYNAKATDYHSRNIISNTYERKANEIGIDWIDDKYILDHSL